MKKLLVVALSALVVPAFAVADNVGSCGWGAKLFDGQKGIAPQVLAVTTNGTFGNQTFGITFGTSGCTQDGVVRSAWKTAAYLDGNMNKFARDVSRGNGESLDSLATLLNVDTADRAVFAQTLKQNFASLFPSDSATTDQVVVGLKQVLESNAQLSRYAANV